MLKVVPSSRFKRDLRLAIKRGYRMDLLEEVVDTLARQETLDEKYRDHYLSGKFKGLKECHITSDWLLIYKIKQEELQLILSRTGSHSDLFI